MANSSFETSMKGAGEAADEAAKETGREAGNLYSQARTAVSNIASQAKDTAAEAYENVSDLAEDAVARAQDTAGDLDDMLSEEVGRHPKAMVALSVGIGFALGILFASSFRANREPPWYERLRS